MIKFSADMLDKLALEAGKSERKRANLRIHKADESAAQRMINCLNMGTYVRPHKHKDPDKDETFVILKGKLLAVEFDEKGKIKDHLIMDAKGEGRGVHFAAGTWHTFVALENGSCVFECKNGPYNARTDKVFASWAPEEGDKNAETYIYNILTELGQHLEAKISFTSVVKSKMWDNRR